MIHFNIDSWRVKKKASNKDIEAQLLDYEIKIQELENDKSILLEKNDQLEQSIISFSKNMDAINAEKDALNTLLIENTQFLDSERSKNLVLEREMQSLKDDKDRTVNKTVEVLVELIRHCTILKAMGDMSSPELTNSVITKVEYSLLDYGVTIVKESEGEFDPTCQRVVNVQETEDLMKKNHVAQVVRPSYWFAGKCLIPQDVIVYTEKK